MSLQQRVNDELKSSMLARQAVRTGTLRMLKSALGYAQIEKKTETLSDADVMAMMCRNRWLGLEQEGFGIVFLEAASCGVPQVAGESGGAAEGFYPLPHAHLSLV